MTAGNREASMREAQTNWTAQCSEISESEFWDDMMFAPIKRMGFSDGPGAVFHGEPYDYRTCPISRERTATRMAHFVVKDAAANSHFYRWNEPVTPGGIQGAVRKHHSGRRTVRDGMGSAALKEQNQGTPRR